MGVTASGALAGGIGAEIAGGNFWDGARNGAISAGLNHFAHMGANALERARANYIIEKAIRELEKNAEMKSIGRCANYVRRAIEAGGVNTDIHPGSAKDYGPYLENWGFDPLNGSNYVPTRGDISVIQPYSGGSQHGHIQMYTGKQWISDFRQNGFWPGSGYRTNQPVFTIYRW